MGLVQANSERWNKAKVNPSRHSMFAAVAHRLVAAKDKYLEIQTDTDVPWYAVAVIHEREASQRWNANIAQGDRWDQRSHHDPKGRGPFKSFREAAYDALIHCNPKAGLWKDWSPGGTMTILEKYNGLGYSKMGRPSPYIWAGTDQYVSGKYVADHDYRANVVDTQLGCAGMLLAMRELDASVMGTVVPIIVSKPVEPPKPVPPVVAKSWWSSIISMFTKGAK